jgi:1,4-alpha-glucan branching enzyme
MYEQFGAVVTGSRVEFRLFFPDNTIDPTQYEAGGLPGITEIRVRGDFQSQIGGTDWDFGSAPVMVKNPHPNGWLFTCAIDQDLPEGFYEYKYFVTFENETTRWCSDPCAKWGGGEQENSAFVIGGHAATVTPIAQRLPPKDLILYELMIDDFTAEYRGDRAPIDAVRDKLDYLEALGVNGIEFMPWTAWPGSGFSWGYDPFQFFSVEYRYVHDASAPADKLYRLKTLINELHARDIHVVMDGVFNHVRAGIDPNQGFPYSWLYMKPEESPFIGGFERGGFFEEFNYRNKCVQEFIRDVCIYWLDDFAVDGIRFDFTLGFHRRGDSSVGIARLVSDVKNHLAQTGRQNVALILEHLTDNRFDAINDTNQICAGACWFDPLMYASFQHVRSGHIDGQLLRMLNANLDYSPGKGPVTYIENHDHSTVVHEAGGRGRWFKTQPAAIALMTSPGAAMVHNGQEFGEDYFLPGSGSGRVEPRPLRWNAHGPDSGELPGGRLYAIYGKLAQIRKDHPALRSANFFPYPFNHADGYGVFPDQDIIVFHRWGDADDGSLERFLIVINYSDFDQQIDIPFSTNGQWQDLLNEDSVVVEDFRLHGQWIPSNWGRVYHQAE